MRRAAVAAAFALALAACGEPLEPPPAEAPEGREWGSGGVDPAPEPGPDGEPLVTYTEARAPCARRNPLREVYFGDLHVHTVYSLDAFMFGTRNTPADAYRFARGEPVELASGETAQLERPLDFAAATDHSEFIGATGLCQDESAPEHDSSFCEALRDGDPLGLGADDLSDAAGESGCRGSCALIWRRIQQQAEAAYDRTAACSFTTFVGYEFTYTPAGNMTHRNVIFRNANVPGDPISWLDVPGPHELWESLRRLCLEAGTGCDVLAIPHNPNYSGGRMFAVEYPGAATIEEEREQAAFRAAMEPLLEVFQGKGASECFPGFSSDEACAFELIRTEPLCNGDGTGIGDNCVAELDYLRGGLGAGLQEWLRLGVNPYPLGVISSTDTHNGTVGDVEETSFQGHHGVIDSTPRVRMVGRGTNNPGGLAAVWAVENSRDAIFEALRRRETYATSGPRIVLRAFAGWDYPDSACVDPDMLEVGYRDGVPMGGILDEAPAASSGPAAPRLIIQAIEDLVPLERVQVIKGWVELDGSTHEEVFDVVTSPGGASVDPETCEPVGAGLAEACAVWTDPDFDPLVPAYYYVRVLENPTCRWSTYDCASIRRLRPAACDDGSVPETIQERAWSSPIFYLPAS